MSVTQTWDPRGYAHNARFVALIPRPTPLPGAIIGWLDTFAQNFTAALPEAERSRYLDEVRSALEPRLRDAEGRWVADYVRLRLSATKPAP